MLLCTLVLRNFLTSMTFQFACTGSPTIYNFPDKESVWFGKVKKLGYTVVKSSFTHSTLCHCFLATFYWLKFHPFGSTAKDDFARGKHPIPNDSITQLVFKM